MGRGPIGTGNAADDEGGSHTGEEDTDVDGEATEDTSDEDTEDSTDQDSDDAASDEESEDDEAEDNEADWDDDTVDAVWDAYRDRFLDRDSIKKEMSRTIKQQVEDQVSKRLKTQEVEDQRDQAATQGRESVDRLKRQMDSVVAELKNAGEGEDFDASVLDLQEYGRNLHSFGRSIADEVSTRYDSALKDSIETALTDAIPELTEDQVEEFNGILNVAERMEGDPRQYEQAKHYFVGNMLTFLLERAKDAGALDERVRQQTKSKVGKKIADSNAVKAAQAKLAGKKKVPPSTPKNKPVARPAGGKEWDSAHYRSLKRGDNPQEAQAYVDAFIKAGGR